MKLFPLLIIEAEAFKLREASRFQKSQTPLSTFTIIYLNVTTVVPLVTLSHSRIISFPPATLLVQSLSLQMIRSEVASVRGQKEVNEIN